MSKDLMKAGINAGMMLFNPTNEDFEMQYAGRSFTLHSKKKMEVNERAGNHLLNAFGQRGLTFLKYGDDEEKVGKDAIERNIAFKKRLIYVYNQTNEQRKMSGHLGYHTPSKELTKYALELGVKLMEPYTMQDEQKMAISKSTEENIQIKAENKALKEDLASIKEILDGLVEAKEKETAQRYSVTDYNKGKKSPGRPPKKK